MLLEQVQRRERRVRAAAAAATPPPPPAAATAAAARLFMRSGGHGSIGVDDDDGDGRVADEGGVGVLGATVVLSRLAMEKAVAD